MSNYAKINSMDVVNGEGIRVSIFLFNFAYEGKPAPPQPTIPFSRIKF